MSRSYAAFAATIAVAAGLLAAPAMAVTLDFVDYTDNVVGERAVISNFNLGGLTVTAHGTNNTAGGGTFASGPWAYLDAGNAGMGVCQNLNGTQCSPASDDNVTGNNPTEILSLSFATATTIEDAFFRNDGHTPNFGANAMIDVAIGNGAFISYTLLSGLIDPLLGATLTGLPDFALAANEEIHFKYNNQQFYLSGIAVNPVPLPAALPLFGAGLAGLGFVGWRRKRKAATA